jgi:hypothetical protein
VKQAKLIDCNPQKSMFSARHNPILHLLPKTAAEKDHATR